MGILAENKEYKVDRFFCWALSNADFQKAVEQKIKDTPESNLLEILKDKYGFKNKVAVNNQFFVIDNFTIYFQIQNLEIYSITVNDFQNININKDIQIRATFSEKSLVNTLSWLKKQLANIKKYFDTTQDSKIKEWKKLLRTCSDYIEDENANLDNAEIEWCFIQPLTITDSLEVQYTFNKLRNQFGQEISVNYLYDLNASKEEIKEQTKILLETINNLYNNKALKRFNLRKNIVYRTVF